MSGMKTTSSFCLFSSLSSFSFSSTSLASLFSEKNQSELGNITNADEISYRFLRSDSWLDRRCFSHYLSFLNQQKDNVCIREVVSVKFRRPQN